MSKLFIPNSIALRNFDTIFINNDFNFSDSELEITFHPTYVAMHPIGFAFYAAIADHYKENRIKRTASMNHDIRSIPFLQRMGLFEALGFSQ